MSLLQMAKNFMPFAGDTVKAVQGMFQIASAGDIGRAKKKLLESRAKYNRKQIEEALSKNYAKVLSQYANKRNDINMQRSQADSTIRIQATQNVGDIDIDGSSFKATAYGKLDEEYARGLNALEDANTETLIQLAANSINQEMQVNMAENKSKIKIDAETQQQKAEGWGKIFDAAVGIGSTLFEQQKTAELNDETAKQINDMTNKLIVPTMNSWNNYVRQNTSMSGLYEMFKNKSYNNYGGGY